MHWRSRLIHPQRQAPAGFRSLVPAVERGSTVVFESQAVMRDDWDAAKGYGYGLFGTPTVQTLAARIAEIEGAAHTFITPGGQAAIVLALLGLCRAGSHVLLPESAYGPTREIAMDLLAGLGIRTQAYDPLLGGDIAALLRDDTALVWTESPGSITMEVQDVSAIVRAAHARNVPVVLDNTWSAGVLFDAFAHGVDVSLQALTKYVGGHSDLLLGSVSVRDAALRERIGRAFKLLGMGVSPDEASLALRGLKTLGVRLERLERSTLEVARWLAQQPQVETVLHPALSSCPGHATWARDFSGSSSVFSIVLHAGCDVADTQAFADRLELFDAGWSWGGANALVTTYPALRRRADGARLVRLNIGLEEPADLIADLGRSLSMLPAPA